MKRSRKSWRLAAVAWSLAAIALADQGIQMHRSQAGTFTVNTWVPAESTEGRFSVQMPAPFDDFTQRSRIPGETTRAYLLEARTPEGIRFSAARGEIPDAAEALSRCQKMRGGSAFGRDLVSRRNLKAYGHDVVELTVRDGRAWMQMRVICLERENLILMVAAPLDKTVPAMKLAETFFDSLKIRSE
jgi:hypothetical protein